MFNLKYILLNEEPGAGGGEPATPAAPAVAPVAAPASDANWYDSLPEDMRTDQNITKFDSVESMGKSWLNAQRMIGQDKIPMPQTDEDWGNVYSRLGRPDEATGYQIAAPEGTQVNEERQSAFLDIAHQLGLSQKQVEGISNWDFQSSASASESLNSNNEAATNEGIQSLKTEWGQAYDQNVQVANRAVNEFVGEADLKFIQETEVNGVRLADHPVLVKMFANIGKGMMESGKLEGQGNEQAMTPQEMEDKRSTLMSNPAYTDNRHPEHKQIMRQVQQLFEQQFA